MEFVEIIVADIEGEAAETISALFNQYGYGGAVLESYPPDFERVTVRTVVPGDDPARLRQIEVMLALIGAALPKGLPAPRQRLIGENDWAESWKEHFHAMRVGRRFVLKPSWRDYEASSGDDLVLELDPGLAFGSGLHPTTQLCLKILEETPSLPGQSLFDVGTGSGILALAAARLRAQPVRAVDVDEVAVEVAAENVARNGLTAQIELAVGSAGDAGGRQWHVVVANILANTLIELMADLGAALVPGGRLILSGLLAEQEQEVADALAKHGLCLVSRHITEDWVALVATTPEAS